MMIYDVITEKIPIEKGWSGDKKYRAVTADGEVYLLRLSPLQRYDRRKREFENMVRVSGLGVSMCQPIEFGTCPEGVYRLESFIEGQDAEAYIPELPVEKQYAYGLDAGRILAKLHTLPAPADVPGWEIRFQAKIDRKIAMYENCLLKYDKGELLLSYIAENRHLLNGRPQSYQHGDYHIGNMMVDTAGELVIIDFDRDDYGDPWEEFNRIVWCAQASAAFASGMVDGYFSGSVPMEFWKLLALYICSNALGSLPWAIPFGEGEISVMRAQTKEVLAWFDNMKNPVPTWYMQARTE